MTLEIIINALAKIWYFVKADFICNYFMKSDDEKQLKIK